MILRNGTKCLAWTMVAMLSPALAAAQDRSAAHEGDRVVSIPNSEFASPEAQQWWSARNEAPRDFDSQVRVLAAKQSARYAVSVTPRVIGGVETEVFEPVKGVPRSNRRRVLINLHGGAFLFGAVIAGRVESIPISSIARIRVVSINYRQAPAHRFPAASEDVATVYRELLREYRPENIGIYGCSAGALLTAQSVAWFMNHQLPSPGAVGMLCGTGELFSRGDSAYFSAALDGRPLATAIQRREDVIYLETAKEDDPLVFPMRHPDVLRRFPPSLLVTAARAYELSSVAHANNSLTLAGVDSHLYVWDGLAHAFQYDPDLPESRQVYDIVARFFDEHLGRNNRARRGCVH